MQRTASGMAYDEVAMTVWHLVDRLRENVTMERRVIGTMTLMYARTHDGASMPVGMVTSVTRARRIWADELEMFALAGEGSHLVTYRDGYGS